MVKNLPASVENVVGAVDAIPGLGSSLEEGNGNPLQFCCLENLTDGEAWQATVHGVANSWTRLSMHAHHTKNHDIIRHINHI